MKNDIISNKKNIEASQIVILQGKVWKFFKDGTGQCIQSPETDTIPVENAYSDDHESSADRTVIEMKMRDAASTSAHDTSRPTDDIACLEKLIYQVKRLLHQLEEKEKELKLKHIKDVICPENINDTLSLPNSNIDLPNYNDQIKHGSSTYCNRNCDSKLIYSGVNSVPLLRPVNNCSHSGFLTEGERYTLEKEKCTILSAAKTNDLSMSDLLQYCNTLQSCFSQKDVLHVRESLKCHPPISFQLCPLVNLVPLSRSVLEKYNCSNNADRPATINLNHKRKKYEKTAFPNKKVCRERNVDAIVADINCSHSCLNADKHAMSKEFSEFVIHNNSASDFVAGNYESSADNTNKSTHKLKASMPKKSITNSEKNKRASKKKSKLNCNPGSNKKKLAKSKTSTSTSQKSVGGVSYKKSNTKDLSGKNLSFKRTNAKKNNTKIVSSKRAASQEKKSKTDKTSRKNSTSKKSKSSNKAGSSKKCVVKFKSVNKATSSKKIASPGKKSPSKTKSLKKNKASVNPASKAKLPRKKHKSSTEISASTSSSKLKTPKKAMSPMKNPKKTAVGQKKPMKITSSLWMKKASYYSSIPESLDQLSSQDSQIADVNLQCSSLENKVISESTATSNTLSSQTEYEDPLNSSGSQSTFSEFFTPLQSPASDTLDTCFSNLS